MRTRCTKSRKNSPKKTNKFQMQQNYRSESKTYFKSSEVSDILHDLNHISVQTPEMENCPINLSSSAYYPSGGSCHNSQTKLKTKLESGQAGDKFEQEADLVANYMMSIPKPRLNNTEILFQTREYSQHKPAAKQIPARIQRTNGPQSSVLQHCINWPNAESKLRNAVSEAGSLSERAVQGLRSLISIWGQEPTSILDRSTARALALGFNIEFDKTIWVSVLGMDENEVANQDRRDREAVNLILNNFEQIKNDLPNYSNPPACERHMVSGSPCFGCVGSTYHRCQRGAIAFVPEPFIGSPSSAILFCPEFFNFGATEAGEILVHELAHLQRFAASDRIGNVNYYGCPVRPLERGPGLREPSQYIGIADSYRCFVKTQREYAVFYTEREKSRVEIEQAIQEVLEPQNPQESTTVE